MVPMYQRFWCCSVFGAFTLAQAVCMAEAPTDRAAQREIQIMFQKAVEGLKQAKTIEDLDALHNTIDTSDWVSIQPGQKPQTWQELRKLGFDALNQPFNHMRFDIKNVTLDGNIAVVEGVLIVGATIIDEEGRFGPKDATHDVVVGAPLRETWVRSANGWRRKIHEKLEPNRALIVDGKPVAQSSHQ